MDAAALQDITRELQPLIGARIQRVDVVDDGEVVFELRVPSRTLRLLVATRAGVDRVHLVDRRPPKRIASGSFQALLRRRFEGRPVIGLEANERTFFLAVPGSRIAAKLGAGKDAIGVETIGEERPS